MSDPLVHAFFVGRAIAEAINEQVESAVTNALSELGKFDAEQRERLREFSDQVSERAAREEQYVMQHVSTSSSIRDGATSSDDIQEIIDDLRAEIAQLRAELQRYRNNPA